MCVKDWRQERLWQVERNCGTQRTNASYVVESRTAKDLGATAVPHPAEAEGMKSCLPSWQLRSEAGCSCVGHRPLRERRQVAGPVLGGGGVSPAAVGGQWPLVAVQLASPVPHLCLCSWPHCVWLLSVFGICEHSPTHRLPSLSESKGSP